MKNTALSMENEDGFPDLFGRVVAILEQARSHAARSINHYMVLAYWQIGKEIIQEQQQGKSRAHYGQRVIESLSERLAHHYGRGFSVTSLKYFRTFYLVYADRTPEIGRLTGDQFKKGRQTGDESSQGFHPNLSWSHYRALMRVENIQARAFYEIEATNNGWKKVDLERQIHSFFYERLLKSQDKQGMLKLTQEGHHFQHPIDMIKDPYILEFLDLPDDKSLRESDLESALIDNLQAFLLELGKGFSFVARQKRIRFEDEDFYVDLVFYNFLLKCFVLIDLKIGKLTHQDIGQIDSYVRMYEDQFKVQGDNPTIGLILCSQKNEAVARYSVLNESQQIFASKYKLYLPDEEELRRELQRERQLIEGQTVNHKTEEDVK
jgi:predicted nuclease of restriction endonuclease-like (RecB) superfamily